MSQSNAPARRFRILIVDDHPVVREGLMVRIAQQPNLEVCGEAADLADALHLAATTQPDLAVVDISLQSGNGLDLIKRIKARNDSVRMLVWSMHSEALYAERALRAGAMGYITKETATSKIIEAITQVLEGKIYLSAEVSEQLLNRHLGRDAEAANASSIEELSDRELEVFRLLGQGLDTQRVAEHMHISPKTVETYRGRIKEKLNLTNMTELVCRAAQWVFENQ